MKMLDILFEAGEPENPSRRGFLKKAGAVGASAMVDPSSLLKGTGELAKSAISPLVSALAKPAALEARLVAAAAAWAFKNSDEICIDGVDPRTGEYGAEWDPGKNDVGKSETDPDAKDVEDIRGTMPWGDWYMAKVSPSGLPYLQTSTAAEEDALITYMNKDGKTHSFILLPHEFEEFDPNDGYDEIPELRGDFVGNVIDIHAATGRVRTPYRDHLEKRKEKHKKDVERHNASLDRWDPYEIIKKTTGDSSGDDTNNDTGDIAGNVSGDIAGSLAKRSLLSRLGAGAVSALSKIKPTPEPDEPNELPAPEKPLELPAPDEPEQDDIFNLDLSRMKDLAGIKKKT